MPAGLSNEGLTNSIECLLLGCVNLIPNTDCEWLALVGGNISFLRCWKTDQFSTLATAIHF